MAWLSWLEVKHSLPPFTHLNFSVSPGGTKPPGAPTGVISFCSRHTSPRLTGVSLSMRECLPVRCCARPVLCLCRGVLNSNSTTIECQAFFDETYRWSTQFYLYTLDILGLLSQAHHRSSRLDSPSSKYQLPETSAACLRNVIYSNSSTMTWFLRAESRQFTRQWAKPSSPVVFIAYLRGAKPFPSPGRSPTSAQFASISIDFSCALC